MDKAVADLGLSQAGDEKAVKVVDRYHVAQKQAFNAMLVQMSEVLTPDQFEAFKRSISPRTQTVDATHVPAIITDGYDTDPRDRGRPVILIAAALNVSDDVFRKAFSGVHPAGPGQRPTDAEARQNKRVLLDALTPYGRR